MTTHFTENQDHDSFLGARMRFPEPSIRIHSQPAPGPASRSSLVVRDFNASKTSQSKTRNPGDSTNPHLRKAAREKHSSKPKSRSQRKQISPEEMQIQRLYLEANRHQAATARVTNLEDFQTMTFTLPAAKQACSTTRMPSTPEDGHAKSSPFRPRSPLLTLLISSSSKSKNGTSMFRGKKTWTSSAAAGSCIAEANEADRYYYSSNRGSSASTTSGHYHHQSGVKKTYSSPHRCHRLGHIMEEEQENKRRWASLLLPKKWTCHRSLSVEV